MTALHHVKKEYMSEMSSVERRLRGACLSVCTFGEPFSGRETCLGSYSGDFLSARAVQPRSGLPQSLPRAPSLQVSMQRWGQQAGKWGEVPGLGETEKETILILRSCHFTQNKCHWSYECKSFIVIDLNVL